tara:strand:- start:19927 stop:20349 length:423 start_codon:yes stop_codon:yes gene_type:complete
MEIKVLGFKIRPVVVVLCLLVGMIIGGFALCSCSKITLQQVKEGFDGMGSEYSNNMSTGVMGSYGERRMQDVTQNIANNKGPVLPLPNGEMFFFANNEFKPECCLPPFSSVSSADGCACITKEQVDYINSRGGNRSCGIY